MRLHEERISLSPMPLCFDDSTETNLPCVGEAAEGFDLGSRHTQVIQVRVHLFDGRADPGEGISHSLEGGTVIDDARRASTLSSRPEPAHHSGMPRRSSIEWYSAGWSCIGVADSKRRCGTLCPTLSNRRHINVGGKPRRCRCVCERHELHRPPTCREEPTVPRTRALAVDFLVRVGRSSRQDQAHGHL